MSQRETVFQAFVSAASAVGSVTVLPRRLRPASVDQLPVAMMVAGDVRRARQAYNLVENRLQIVVMIIAETITEVEAAGTELITAIDSDTSLASVIESVALSGISEDAEQVAQQINHQQLTFELVYMTTALGY